MDIIIGLVLVALATIAGLFFLAAAGHDYGPKERNTIRQKPAPQMMAELEQLLKDLEKLEERKK